MNLNSTPAFGTLLPEHGGHFGGVIRHGAALLAVIWAPKAEGETTGTWLPTYTDVPAARSTFDSQSNTSAMAEAGSAIAQWAKGLTIGGFTDWALPARDVLELAYRHLKPTTGETGCYFRDGDNPSSVPAGFPYAIAPVLQTTAAAFQAGGAEALEDEPYWSSTQYSDDGAWYQYFSHGNQGSSSKSAELRARAVRLIQLDA